MGLVEVDIAVAVAIVGDNGVGSIFPTKGLLKKISDEGADLFIFTALVEYGVICTVAMLGEANISADTVATGKGKEAQFNTGSLMGVGITLCIAIKSINTGR
ncbi:MAG: hypothetical protein V7707_11160 [Motiliproteus sp.]